MLLVLINVLFITVKLTVVAILSSDYDSTGVVHSKCSSNNTKFCHLVPCFIVILPPCSQLARKHEVWADTLKNLNRYQDAAVALVTGLRFDGDSLRSVAETWARLKVGVYQDREGDALAAR